VSRKPKFDVYIVDCPFVQNKDEGATKASVADFPCLARIFIVSSFSEFKKKRATRKTEWALLLYAREVLDSKFKDAMEVMVSEKTADAYKFCCVVAAMDKPIVQESIRMYRKTVEIASKRLAPLDASTNVTKILDGWIFEHGTADNVCAVFRDEETAE